MYTGGSLATTPLLTGSAVVVVAVAAFWAAKAIRVARCVPRYASYWAVPRGEPGGLLYVALGDSAAQGIGASRPELGYVGLLTDRMRERTGGPVTTVNLSQCGATLRDLIDRQLPLLQDLSPDVVTVAIGGNDIRAYSAARFADEVCLLTAGLPVGSLVADVPYFMHGRGERHADEAGRVLSECVQANRLISVRLHDAEQARGPMAMLTDFSADWFHPNDRGHRVWADAFWTELHSLPALKQGRPAA